jgi:hypothetical protein
LSNAEAKSAASSTLGGLCIENLSKRIVADLAPPERRVAILAQAMLPSAQVLITQSPLETLEGPAAKYVLAVMDKISQSRKVLATSARFDTSGADRELALGADHLVIFDGEGLAWQGNPDELLSTALYSLRIRGNSERFGNRLRELNCQVLDNDERPRVSLPEGEATSLLFAAARETESTIIEMIPLFHPSKSP